MVNPQSWNRYSYVTNRPINFGDPSGHRECEYNHCDFGLSATSALKKDLETTYDIKIKGSWTQSNLSKLRDALNKAATFAGGADNLNDVFHDALRANKVSGDKLTFDYRPGAGNPTECRSSPACWAYWEGTIVIGERVFSSQYQTGLGLYRRPLALGYSDPNLGAQTTILHEIAHAFADARPSAHISYMSSVSNPYAFTGARSKSSYTPDERPGARGESMVTAYAIYITTGGQAYPGYQDQMDFVKFTQYLWETTPY